MIVTYATHKDLVEAWLAMGVPIYFLGKDKPKKWYLRTHLPLRHPDFQKYPLTINPEEHPP